MKKSLGLLAVLALTATTLVGCAAQPTQADYEKWAADNGYTKLEALPTAWSADMAEAAAADTYKTQYCGIAINPTLTNPNAQPLSNYLNREDVRYYDLRDVAEGYGVIHIEGFESVSYFKTLVGTGDQLFNSDFTPRYVQSVAVLNSIFPKDKAIFAMCKVGGRVAPFMRLLAANGYDMSKCYNIGGSDQLNDDLGLQICRGIGASQDTPAYDFSSLTLA